MTCGDGPWREQTIAQSKDATLVLATRWGCGFPDADLEYRLYRVAQPWQLLDEGLVEVKHMDPRMVPVDDGMRTAANGVCSVDRDNKLRCGPRSP